MNQAKNTTPQTGSVMSSLNEIDIHQLFHELLGAKRIILIITTVFFVIGLVIALTRGPTYQSGALIQVTNQSSGISSLTSLANVVNTFTSHEANSSPADIESTLIQSRYVLEPVINKLHLNISASAHHTPIFGHFSSNKGKEIVVTALSTPPTWLNKKLSLSKDSKNGYTLYGPDDNKVLQGTVGTLATSKRYPDISIQVKTLNGPVGTSYDLKKIRMEQAISNLQRNLTITTNNKTLNRGQQTGIMNIDLNWGSPTAVITVLNSILDTAYQLNIKQQAQDAQNILSFLDKQLPIVKAELQKAEDALSAYQTKTGNVGIDVQSQVLLQEIVQVNQQLEQLKLDKTELLQKYTRTHPYVMTINNKIKQVQKELTSLQNKVKSLPETDKKSVALLRDVKTKNQLYLLLLTKQQQMQILKAGAISNLKILDSAYTPPKMLPRHRLLIVIVAVLLGLILSTALIIIKMLFKTGIQDPDIIEQQFGIPVQAVIPHSKRQEELSKVIDKSLDNKQHILATEAPNDISIESLRSLRTSLQMQLLESDGNAICITGLTPNIGKSFISLNLAKVFNDGNKRVLLIDGDLRKGKIHKALSKTTQNGLSNYLAGETDVESLPLTVCENFDFISRGTQKDKPSELLNTTKLADLLQHFRSEYDVIIIDSAPLLSIGDSISITKHCDINIMTLSTGAHSLREVKAGFNALLQNNIKISSAIFNFRRSGGRSSYYHYYGYSYKYYNDYVKD